MTRWRRRRPERGASDPGRPPLVRWAHQGGACEAPSNTMAAMERAMTAGRATALEMDVHLSADGELVVIHDKTLDRTTDGCGRVRRHTLAQLRSLDAAHWWVDGKVVDHHAPPEAYRLRGRAPGDRNYCVPLAVEILDRFRSVPFTIEIKDWRAAGPLVDALAAQQRTNVVLTSFGDHVLWLVRRHARRHPGWEPPLAPGLVYTVWFVLRSTLRVPPRRSRYARIQVPPRKFGIPFATRALVAAARRAGMEVDVWTVDDEPTMRSLIGKGVDGILTDRPSVLADVAEPTP